MANFVHISSTNIQGAKVIAAIGQIADGLGTLQQWDGQRGEAIAVDAETMQAVFGVATAAEAQILSDRWDALMQAFEGTIPAWATADPYALMRDLINQTVRS